MRDWDDNRISRRLYCVPYVQKASELCCILFSYNRKHTVGGGTLPCAIDDYKPLQQSIGKAICC